MTSSSSSWGLDACKSDSPNTKREMRLPFSFSDRAGLFADEEGPASPIELSEVEDEDLDMRPEASLAVTAIAFLVVADLGSFLEEAGAMVCRRYGLEVGGNGNTGENTHCVSNHASAM